MLTRFALPSTSCLQGKRASPPAGPTDGATPAAETAPAAAPAPAPGPAGKPPLEAKVQAAFLAMFESFFDKSCSALEMEHAALIALERDNGRLMETKGEASDGPPSSLPQCIAITSLVTWYLVNAQKRGIGKVVRKRFHLGDKESIAP